MLSFRLMTATDVELVLCIEQQASASPWRRQEIQHCLDSQAECWVACLNHDIVGYALVSSVLDESSLLNLCVSSRHQGKGFGRAFVKHLLDQATGSNKAKFFLEVRASNQVAIRLYETSGFKRIGLRKGYYKLKNGREDGLTYAWDSKLSE